MFKISDIVEFNGKYGRVMYYDPITYTVHVLFKISNNTWKVEKCDYLFCKPAQVFLWSIESAFCTKPQRKQQTPELVPLNADDDYFMEI
jgi:hypothetical protein